jgi:hypothetical protein
MRCPAHTISESDFSAPCIIGYDLRSSRCGPRIGFLGRVRRSPGSRAGDIRTCQGLRRRGAGPALALARRSMLPSASSRASALRTEFTPLNGWPARIPVNASRTASRQPAHDSGPVWFARPSLRWTCTTHLLPVSRRTEKFRQVNVHDEPIAFDDVGLRLRHRLASGAARPEAVAVLAECRVPQRLEPLQDRLLDRAIDHGWHSHVELHSSAVNLWVPLKLRIHSIHYEANGSSY